MIWMLIVHWLQWLESVSHRVYVNQRNYVLYMILQHKQRTWSELTMQWIFEQKCWKGLKENIKVRVVDCSSYKSNYIDNIVWDSRLEIEIIIFC